MSENGKNERKVRGLPVLGGAASFVVVVAGLYSAKAILVPLLLALFLAIIGSVPSSWLIARKCPRWISIIAVSIVMIGIVLGVCVLLVNSVEQFTRVIPSYQQRLTDGAQSIVTWLNDRGVFLSEDAQALGPEAGTVMNWIGAGLRGLVTTLSATIMVVIMMVFMLFEASQFQRKLRAAFESDFDFTKLERVTSNIQRYLGIKTLTSALTGIAIFLWVSYMRIDFAILWGIIGFLLNYIPIIGSTIASIPVLLMTLGDFGIGKMLVVGVGYLVINNLISNVIEPIWMGVRLGLSPLVVFFSLVFWGWLWGPVGMILSVPLTMVLKILLEHSREFSWIAMLLGSKAD